MCTQIWILVEDLWIRGRDFMKYPWEIFWQKIINTILKSWDVRLNSNILNIGVEIFSARLFRKLIGFCCLWERWYSAIVYRVYVGVSGKRTMTIYYGSHRPEGNFFMQDLEYKFSRIWFIEHSNMIHSELSNRDYNLRFFCTGMFL